MAKKIENLVYGIRSVLETLNSGKDLERVFIQKGLKGDLIDELKAVLKGTDTPISMVPIEKLNRFTRKNHQGTVVLVSPVQYFPLDQVIAQTYEKGEVPLLLLLDGVTDVRNFGSIARTAECMGVHGIIIPGQGSAQINADAVKTSAGALNFIPVCREPNINLAVNEMKNSGIKIVACTEKSDKTLNQFDFTAPVCLVMGAEDVGISGAILTIADEKGKLPLYGQIESLNVGSACSMALYEITSQRSK